MTIEYGSRDDGINLKERLRLRSRLRKSLNLNLKLNLQFYEFMVKLLRAYGGCLGARRRRKTWQAAISFGEPLNRLRSGDV